MAGLLNVGEMGALALHVLVELAKLRGEDPDARRTVQDLASALSASSHTLHKVVRRLATMGLVEGTRGANGGLRLTGDPASVTMLSVIEGIEGRICSNGCMFRRKVCPAAATCVFSPLTVGLETRIREYFENTTLADLRDMAGKPDGKAG